MEFRLRVLVGAAVLAGVAGGLVPLGAASADVLPTDLYVSQAESCSMNGPGTEAVPFCMIQEAADVVEPGQTVHIAAGNYGNPVRITRSGTPDAPISFVGAGTNIRSLPSSIDVNSGTAPAVTLTGVHDVNVSNLFVLDMAGTDGVAVVDSHRIGLATISGDIMLGMMPHPEGTSAAFRVDGSSSDVSITLGRAANTYGSGVTVEAGAQDVTVAGNILGLDTNGGVRATGAVGLVVTGNTVKENPCAPDILLDGATSATVENNSLRSAGQAPSTCTVAPLLSVAAESAGTVHSDYNAVDTTTLNTSLQRPAYSWAGTGYASAADFAAAAPGGQGAHDVDSTDATNAWDVPPAGSPLIDSADANAPGITSLDLLGNARVLDNPGSPNTGTGTGTLDRGAVETQSLLTVTQTYTPADARCTAPCVITAGASTQDSWGETVTAVVDFGDGSAPQPMTDGTASHEYTVPGEYIATITATNSDGQQKQISRQVLIGTSQTPSVSLGWEYATAPGVDGANVYDSGHVMVTPSFSSDDWQIAEAAYDFGDGGAPVVRTGGDAVLGFEHPYTVPGTYTATATTTDLFGRTSTASATYTVGDVVVPQAPVRVYDSRTAYGAIPAHGTLTLSRDQFALPNDATVHGFYLTATVTGASRGGVLSVYPHGTARPQASVLNFPAGHNVANTVLAVPSSAGKIDFYNSSAAGIDLVLDQFGVEAGAAADGSERTGDTYSPLAPARILDTRNGTGTAKGAVAGKANVTFKAAGVAGVPSNAAAVVLNLAATHTKAAGHLTAYPHGTAYPGTSNLNWAAGQTASNLAVVPLTDGKIVVNNGSTAAADIFADVVGYYHRYGTSSVIVPTASQVRVLDTRTGVGTAGRIAKIPAKGTVRLALAGTNGLPANCVTAADLNLTVTHQTGSGHIVAYPDGTALPNSSSVNFRAGQTVANAAVVPLGADGAVDLYNSGPTSVDLIADLAGYYCDDPRD